MLLSKFIQNYEFRLLNNEKVDPIYSRAIVVNRPCNLKIGVSKRLK